MTKRRKSIFGNLFEVVEKDPIEKAVKEQQKKGSATIATPAVTQPIINAPITSVTGGMFGTPTYTGKFDNVFDTIIEKENIPGPDVQELITSVREMQVNGLPEDMAYRNAFTAFKSMGLTKEKLIETSNYYLGVITNVNTDFQTNIIGKKETELTEIDTRHKTVMAKIEQLTEEARVLAEQRKELNNDIVSSKQEMEGSFNKATAFFNNVILKIQTYL